MSMPSLECNCESMGGRFGAHRPQCPWQVAFEEEARREQEHLVGEIAQVLDQHRWKTMGVDFARCECGQLCRDDGSLTRLPGDQAFRTHVAEQIVQVL